MEHIPSILASGSEGALKKKDIIRNTGNLLRIRQYLYLNDENLIDMPEMFWSSPELESGSPALLSCPSVAGCLTDISRLLRCLPQSGSSR